MPERRRSTTDRSSFHAILSRLSHHRAVDGLIVIGSARSGSLSASSDYDLVVVLSEMPVPLHVGVTTIDGRFSDIIFCTTAHVQEVLETDKPLSVSTWEGRLIGWLQEGELVFDRRGHLQQSQDKVNNGNWLQDQNDLGAAPWNGVNYNLAVLRRYLRSDDPLYLKTADIRMMLYGPSDLFFNYFAARNIHWSGEKDAIRYLEQHDPAYLDLYLCFLAERERWTKFELYEKLAALTIEPVGSLWQNGDTIMMLTAAKVTPALEQQALDFWEELVAVPADYRHQS